MARPNLKEGAEIEAQRIKYDLEKYRLADAIERTLAFSQSFFAIASPEYRMFRDKAVSLSNRFAANNASRLESSTRHVRDSDEDVIICDINTLATRMSRAARLLDQAESESDFRQASSARPIVNIENCYKDFAGSDFSLRPISVTLDEGDVLALMGPNASGKSTLLRLILGELAPSRGTVTYPGLKWTFSHRGLRSQIGYVPQFAPIWSGSLGQHLRYYLSVRGVRGEENHKRVEYYLHRFHLKRFEDHSCSEISGG
jgi:ABC-type multidrug transport system fused ATPase/permease subunit